MIDAASKTQGKAGYIGADKHDTDDGFDYSIPTVREVREQYVIDGQFIVFCQALERAIRE